MIVVVSVLIKLFPVFLFHSRGLPWRSQQNLLTQALQYFVARRKGRPIVGLLWSLRQLRQPWFSPHI